SLPLGDLDGDGQACDAPARLIEGARREQRSRGVREDAAGEAAPGTDGDRRPDLAAAFELGELVGDVEADGAGGAQREPVGRGLVDLEVEADALSRERAADAGTAAGAQARGVQPVDLEWQRRPLGAGVG